MTEGASTPRNEQLASGTMQSQIAEAIDSCSLIALPIRISAMLEAESLNSFYGFRFRLRSSSVCECQTSPLTRQGLALPENRRRWQGCQAVSSPVSQSISDGNRSHSFIQLPVEDDSVWRRPKCLPLMLFLRRKMLL